MLQKTRDGPEAVPRGTSEFSGSAWQFQAGAKKDCEF
jgi:hypothetical protein